METACVVDMAWSTKSIGQNNSLVAGQILIACQFTKLEAGVTNNLLSYSYHKEGDHYNYTCAKVCLLLQFHLDRFESFSPSRRREAPCEGTNSPRLFTTGETKALAESTDHQISRAWVTNRGWSSSLISNIWRTVMNSGH